MRSILLVITLMISSIGFCNEKDVATKAKSSSFNLKSTFADKKNLEHFIVKSVSILDLSSREQVKVYIGKSTEGLFFHDFALRTPIITEFIYQTLKAPQAIGRFISISLMRNELLIFSFGMIFSFVCSHFLGEFKFNFKPLSALRITYSLTRFAGVNAFRVWLFSLLFAKNISPLGKVYMSSLNAVGDSHPYLLKVTSTFAQFF